MYPDEYRKLAETEDRMWYFRALHAHVERELARERTDASMSVLDAGCGTGGLIRRLAPRHRAWTWIGIDVESLACELSRQRLGALGDASGSGPSVMQGSVTSLPFPDGTFDAVVSADVLYHVDDDAAALREFARVLRPGGIVVLNVPAYQWLWSYHDVAVHSCRRYSRRELVYRVLGAGFSAVRATYWNTLPFPFVVVRRKLLPPPAGGSDVQVFPPILEAVFGGAMAAERVWLRVFGRLPFGSSVFAVARKPGGGSSREGHDRNEGGVRRLVGATARH